MTTSDFKFGDRVVHTTRPEWGTGVVTAVQPVVHEGKPAQQLTLRFDRGGLKTISTAVASLRLADQDDEHHPAKDVAGEPRGWLDSLGADNPAEAMSRLPEATRDPFTTLAARIQATIALYRFSDRGSSILDWAAAQTGLADPLSRFNRHQLEEFFKRFAGERDTHLKRLVLELQRKDPAAAEQVLRTAPPTVRDTLRRPHTSR